MGTCQAGQHESGHGGVDPSFRGFRQHPIIFAQSPLPAQPGEGAFHYPAPGKDLKSVLLCGTPHHFQTPATNVPGPLHQLARVGAVSPDPLQPGEAAHQPAQHQLGSIPVLHVGRVYRHRQQQTLSIHHDMPLASLHLLARIVPPRPLFPWPSRSGCR